MILVVVSVVGWWSSLILVVMSLFHRRLVVQVQFDTCSGVCRRLAVQVDTRSDVVILSTVGGPG